MSHLSQSCSLLHRISKVYARAIAEAVECPFPIPLNEALRLATAQFSYCILRGRKDRTQAAYYLFAARVVASHAPSAHFISDGALRLAQAQLSFTAPGAKHYCAYDDDESRDFLEKRLAEARPTTPAVGPFTLFAIRHHAIQNAPDAARVLVLVAINSLFRIQHIAQGCDVHPRDSLLPHEQIRVLSTWYFFKSYVLSYHLPRNASLRKELDAELRDMSAARLYIMLQISAILCDNIADDLMEALGIQDPSEKHLQYGLSRHRQYEDWEDLLENLQLNCQRVVDTDNERWGTAEVSIMGCCDGCDGNCEPRDPGKGVWEL